MEQIYARLIENGPTDPSVAVQKCAVEKDLFKVLSYQAESVSIIVCLHELTVWHFVYINEKVMPYNLLEEGEVSLAFHKNICDLFYLSFVSEGNITWYLFQGR